MSRSGTFTSYRTLLPRHAHDIDRDNFHFEHRLNCAANINLVRLQCHPESVLVILFLQLHCFLCDYTMAQYFCDLHSSIPPRPLLELMPRMSLALPPETPRLLPLHLPQTAPLLPLHAREPRLRLPPPVLLQWFDLLPRRLSLHRRPIQSSAQSPLA